MVAARSASPCRYLYAGWSHASCYKHVVSSTLPVAGEGHSTPSGTEIHIDEGGLPSLDMPPPREGGWLQERP